MDVLSSTLLGRDGRNPSRHGLRGRRRCRPGLHGRGRAGGRGLLWRRLGRGREAVVAPCLGRAQAVRAAERLVLAGQVVGVRRRFWHVLHGLERDPDERKRLGRWHWKVDGLEHGEKGAQAARVALAPVRDVPARVEAHLVLRVERDRDGLRAGLQPVARDRDRGKHAPEALRREVRARHADDRPEAVRVVGVLRELAHIQLQVREGIVHLERANGVEVIAPVERADDPAEEDKVVRHKIRRGGPVQAVGTRKLHGDLLANL
mmetsp:Transcript_18675/g.58225  ORF Transcript_18675/g.58225 Transcript_18675/m.58225 type:complete len:262 (-) Transcript_18675:15-800(-)